MDKLKPVLAVLGKHHFWIICGLVLIIGLTFWSLASADLAKKYQERETKLKGLDDGAKKVASEANPPNPQVIEVAQKSKQALEFQVHKAWEARYGVQKARNPIPIELGRDFKAAYESLVGPDDKLPRPYPELYQTFIRNYFWRLLQIIDLRHPLTRPQPTGPIVGRKLPEVSYDQSLQLFTEMLLRGTSPAMGGAGGMPGGMYGGMPGMMGEGGSTPMPGMMPGYGGSGMGPSQVEMAGRVTWDEQDIKKMFARFIWEKAPSTLEVRLGLETLWVHKALLEIVATTNGDAPLRDIPIQRIESIQIGQEGAQAFLRAENRIVSVGTVMGGMGESGSMPGGSMPGMPGMPGMSGGMYSPMGMPAGPGMESGGGAATAASLADQEKIRLISYRYVDQNGKPLAHDATPPFKEFKMMPVYMKLWIDQMKIPDLLVNCANSAMQVEVHRVSFCPGQGLKANLTLGGAGGGMGGGMPGMPGMPYMPGMESGSGSSSGEMPGGMGPDMYGGAYGGAAGAQQRTAVSHVPIEVLGVIYIFNPPDKELGTGEVATAGGAAPPAPAVATPPPATPAPAAPAPEGAPAGSTPGVPAAAAPPGVAPAVGPAAAVPSPAPGTAPGTAPPTASAPFAPPVSAPTPAASAAPAIVPGAAPAPTPAAVPGAATPPAAPSPGT
jgi:hypothetical protein